MRDATRQSGLALHLNPGLRVFGIGRKRWKQRVSLSMEEYCALKTRALSTIWPVPSDTVECLGISPLTTPPDNKPVPA